MFCCYWYFVWWVDDYGDCDDCVRVIGRGCV